MNSFVSEYNNPYGSLLNTSKEASKEKGIFTPSDTIRKSKIYQDKTTITERKVIFKDA